MSKPRPWERAAEGGAWYDDQPFDIGARVTISDPAERSLAGAPAGRVVGYDASGPRKGEDFYRVLVVPDRPDAAIIALSPHSLVREAADDRRGLALTTLAGLEQTLGAARYEQLLAWLRSPACAQVLADPQIGHKRIRAGGLAIPGLLLGELAALAHERA